MNLTILILFRIFEIEKKRATNQLRRETNKFLKKNEF